MARIANAIHASQRRAGEQSIAQVIFDNNSHARRARGLTQEHHRVLRMVKHINTHHDVHARIAIRNDLPIETIHGDVRVGAHQDVDTFHVNVRPLLHDQMRKPAITTPHVQRPGVCGEQPRQMIAQHANPPSMDVPPVETVDQTHLRRIPKMLTKKLDRMV